MVDSTQYRVLIQDLHSDLLDEDVKCMKFLAQQLIQKRLYEGIQDGLGLLNALEDCGMLSKGNLSFLMELCETVGRMDLHNRICEELEVFTDAVSGTAPMVCPFRSLLYRLYREIPDYDLSRMIYFYGNIPKRATVADPVDFFGFMLRDRTLAPDNLTTLKNILSEISRQDLVEQILTFKSTVRPEECNYKQFSKRVTGPLVQEASLESSMLSTSSAKAYPNLMSESSSVSESGMSYQESDHQMPGIVFQEASIEDSSYLGTGASSYSYSEPGIINLKSLNYGAVSSSLGAGLYSTVGAELSQSPNSQKVNYMQSEMDDIEAIKAQSKTEAFSDDRYKMSADPRGLCVILDVQKFEVERLKFRAGSQHDRSNLKYTFERLKFRVVERVNRSAREMYEFLTDIARSNHSAYDCLVLCILSHGGINYFFGSHGEKVYEDSVFGLFSAKACPTLANKPKLFFFSYCRGMQEQEGVPVIDTDSPATTDLSDFLYGYATPQNYVSYRNRSKGTFYIDVLTRILNESAEREELQHILLKVNREVSKMETGTGNRQVPEPKHTLQKQLYFL